MCFGIFFLCGSCLRHHPGLHVIQMSGHANFGFTKCTIQTFCCAHLKMDLNKLTSFKLSSLCHLPTDLHLPVSEETCLSCPLMAGPLMHSGLSRWSSSSALLAKSQDRKKARHSRRLRCSRTCSSVMETIAPLQCRSCVLCWSSSARVRKKGMVMAAPHKVLQLLLQELTFPG